MYFLAQGQLGTVPVLLLQLSWGFVFTARYSAQFRPCLRKRVGFHFVVVSIVNHHCLLDKIKKSIFSILSHRISVAQYSKLVAASSRIFSLSSDLTVFLGTTIVDHS